MAWSIAYDLGSASPVGVIGPATGTLTLIGNDPPKTSFVIAPIPAGILIQGTIGLRWEWKITPAPASLLSQGIQCVLNIGGPSVNRAPLIGSVLVAGISPSVSVRSLITTQRRFAPGDAMVSNGAGGSDGNYNTTSAAWISEIAALKANPVYVLKRDLSGYVPMYIMNKRWNNLDTGATITNNFAQYSFSDVDACYNYLQSQIPGAYFGLTILFEVVGKSILPSQVPTYGFAAVTVPSIANCGGSLTVPNSFGSAQSTTYPIPAQYGTPYCGFALDAWDLNNLLWTAVSPAMWDPGVRQCAINCIQALAQHIVTVTAGPETGQQIAFANLPELTYIARNDELSMIPSFPYQGGICNAYTNASNQCTSGNMILGRYALDAAMVAAFPNVIIGECLSYGNTSESCGNASHQDTPTEVAAYVNASLPPVSEMGSTPALSTIVGLAFSDSDTYGGDWVNLNGGIHAAQAKQGYLGIQTPAVPDASNALPAATYPSLKNIMPWVAQIQPADYSGRLVSATAMTPGAITELVTAAAFTNAVNRMWWCLDNNFNINTSWGSTPGVPQYIPATVNGSAKCSELLPVGLMIAPTGLNAKNITAASCTLNWVGIVGGLDTGRNLTYTVFQNGISIATGLSSATYNVTGLSGGQYYTFTVALANANGTGPQSSQYIIQALASTLFKFAPFDAFLSSGPGTKTQYTIDYATAQSDINLLKAHPVPGTQAYVCMFKWGDLEPGGTNYIPNNQANDALQYSGFALIEQIFNYLQQQIPGAHFAFYITCFQSPGTSGGTATGIATKNWAQNNYSIPRDISGCGGTLPVANTYGSLSTTNYSVAPIYTGSGFYGINFANYSSSGGSTGGAWFGQTMPAFNNPGINKRYIQLFQALAAYKFQSGLYAGQTIDQCPLIDFIGENTEYSYNMDHTSISDSGATLNGMNSGSTYPLTRSAWFGSYFAFAQSVQAAFPHTMFVANVSFGAGTPGSYDTPENVAADVNDNFPASKRTNTSIRGLSSIRGVGLCASDYVSQTWNGVFNAGCSYQGFVGIDPDITSGYGGVGYLLAATPGWSLSGIMPFVAQVQPPDYYLKLPFQTPGFPIANPGTQSSVSEIMRNITTVASGGIGRTASSWRLWSELVYSDPNTIVPNSWQNVVQPALLANISALPLSHLLPVSWMVAPTGLYATNVAATSCTLNWAGIVGGQNTGTGLGYVVYQNGVVIPGSSGQTGTSYNVTGLTAGPLYTFTVALINANGTGPQSVSCIVQEAAQVFSYPSGFAGTSGTVHTTGGAAVQGANINLMAQASTHDGGGAWYVTRQPSNAFTSHFTFQIPAPSSIPYTTAFCFVVQNSNTTTNPNDTFGAHWGTAASYDANVGGYGCYYPPQTNQYQQYCGNSIGVKFDISGNGVQNYLVGGHPNATGLYINGGAWASMIPMQDMQPYGVDLNLGHIMACTIVYDGTILTMIVKDTNTNAQCRQSWPVNIPLCANGPGSVDSKAYVGFTAGQIQPLAVNIQTWDFSTGYAARIATPTFSVIPGQYTTTQSVALTAQLGASIYYTTNGLEPTSSSTLYASSITVSANTIIKAVAIQAGYTDSLVAIGNYQIQAGGLPLINLPSGFASASGLMTLVAAAKFNGSQIQLTDTTAAPEVGGAWYPVPVGIGTFTANFTLQFSGSGANGMTFCIQNNPPNAGNNTNTQAWAAGGPTAIGQPFTGLGYSQTPGTGTDGQGAGLAASVAVKFDLTNNTTGIFTGGVLPTTPQTTMTGITLNNGHPMNVVLGYDGTTLFFSITDTVTFANFRTSWPVNIPSAVGANTAYVGFTGSTGYAYSNQFINSFTYLTPS